MIGFVFIGGWGNVRKKLVRSLGELPCPNCSRVTTWNVYDIEKRASVFFVPVMKYASQRVVVCSGCGAGAEVTDAEIAQLQAQRQADATRQRIPENVPGKAPERAESVVSVPVDPQLADWLDRLSDYLAKHDYAETRRDLGEEVDGIRVPAIAGFTAGGSGYSIYLLETPQGAKSLESGLLANPDAAESMKRGMLKTTVFDRRVFIAFNPGGLPPGSFGRWTQAAGQLKPPE